MHAFQVDSSHVLHQHAVDVRACSSQYGLHCYSATDVIGAPRIFPEYGDFTDALVMRTYGPWWREAPSAAPPLATSRTCRGRSQRGDCVGEDFVEVVFEHAVFVTGITVFET